MAAGGDVAPGSTVTFVVAGLCLQNLAGLRGLCRSLNVGSRVQETWLDLEDLQMNSLCEWKSQALARNMDGLVVGQDWSGGVVPGTREERVSYIHAK